jgi:hypothetical protein
MVVTYNTISQGYGSKNRPKKNRKKENELRGTKQVRNQAEGDIDMLVLLG